MDGPFEIERRYLVRVPEPFWETLDAGMNLRQGYVKTGDPSVRIRTGELRGAVLTCKSGKGVKRREVETVVPPEVAEALFQAAGERVLEKVRHRLGPWELDRFVDGLEGLSLLEIELEAEDQPIPPAPTGIDVLREVTDDKRFTSSNLARMDRSEQRRLVQAVYRGLPG